ncbi:hypothetical protein [Lacrimispora celerecrescens]|uniref:hypothetical protein n=1 Tax=Lacrimispora celerecrescens TaxID=29354 RepID=UPI00164770E6|nr:hypothetical protein [Lacrimispora celerecrescens]
MIKNKAVNVQHTLCYFCKDGEYLFETRDTKTNNGVSFLRCCHGVKEAESAEAGYFLMEKTLDGYENLIFVTNNNQPTQLFLVKECIGVIIKNIWVVEQVQYI